ncbi:MAG: hypothetical protein CL623_06725 [Arcobacter sp.]|nr:hypothetical protein [Arcobacter sp.]|tara:strand:+ start:939 stop:1328 length:390 start_codon:yes stop_codon:yes gene_type:complete
MIKYLFPFLLFLTVSSAENINTDNNDSEDRYSIENIDESIIQPSVDCLILEDENSIICKFETNRTLKDKEIIVQWIDPQGDVSRSRSMIVPAGHASIYDYRYINGRLLGSWSFKVIENEKEYITNFELK